MPNMTATRLETATWQPFPIPAEQILEGDPAATVCWIHASAAGEPTYWSGLWTAQPSRFRWNFDVHETAHILEGHIRVTEDSGEVREFKAGDIAYFPKGAKTVWEILAPLKKLFVDAG